MPALDDFVTAQHAAELAVLRMSVMAVLSRAAVEDSSIVGIRLEVEQDGFGQPFVGVELIGQGGHAVGGFSL